MNRSSLLVRSAARIGEAIGAAVNGFRTTAQVSDWEGAEVDRLRRRPRGKRVSQDSTLDYGVREDLLSEARDLCNKTGLPNRVLWQYRNYVVGTCQPRWLTSDKDWNDRAETEFYNWSLNCDLKESSTLQQKAGLHIMGMLRDGDSFEIKTELDGEPYLADIEADRVGNYLGGTTNIDEDRIVGGVKIDARRGRPVSYRIWERTRYGQFVNPEDRPAAQVLHIYDPTRFDARRGVTHLAPVLNHLRDLKETVAAQKAKQKLISKIALMVRNAIGGPQSGNIDVLNDDTDAKGVGIKTENLGDAAIKYQFNGDEMEALVANDPSDGWFRLTVHLVREISIGLDLPFEFVWDMAGLAGPGVRMMSAQAHRTFKGKQEILEQRYLNRVTAWWVNFEMQPGRKLPFNDEWMFYRFQRPAHITIDGGRDTKSNLDELSAGVSTECRIAEEQGEDDEEVAETRKNEVRRKLTHAQELVAEFPDLTLAEALDLLGRSNIPKAPSGFGAATPEPATAHAA